MSDEIKPLTQNEEKVLYGLVKFPEYNDKDLASLLNMRDSTLTSIKKRLMKQGYFNYLFIPQIDKLGAELLGIIFTSFNPTRKFEERVEITKGTIEIAEEIFYSVGAPEMGFSLSFSKDYTSFCQINEKRTQTFGQAGLLEKDFPHEVIFPFRISQIDAFFDYDRILEENFADSLEGLTLPPDKQPSWFQPTEGTHQVEDLNEKEKRVFIALLSDPRATMQQIGETVGLSRHTVARMKGKFFDNDLIRVKVIPNLKKIGFKLLVFYHFKFSPNKKIKQEIFDSINSSSTFFCAHRQFNAVIISAYPDYSNYKEDKVKKLTFLKEKQTLNYTPAPRKYVYNQMEIIKEFNFTDIAAKILGVEK